MSSRGTRCIAAALLATFLSGSSLAPAFAQEASARLSLASQTAWMRSDSFTVRLGIDRVRRRRDLALVVSVHRAVTSRSQFVRTATGDLLGSRIYRDAVPLETLRVDAGGATPITLVLPGLRTGVYPVQIQLVDDGDAIASMVTHVVRVPSEPAEVPLAVAWVQPYGAPPALRPDGTVDLPEGELDQLRTVASQFDGRTPLTIEPNPETIAALATSDDGRTVEALGRLLSGYQVLSTAFVDVDPGAIVSAGMKDELLRQRVEGDRVLADTLGFTPDTRTLILRGSVTAEALDALAGVGARRVVLNEDALTPLAGSLTRGVTLARPFAVASSSGQQLEAVAVDAGLTTRFDERDDVLAAHRLLAELAVLYLDAPGTARGVVVRPPDGWEPSEALLSIVLSNLRSSPVLEPVTIAALFDRVDPLTDRRGEPVVRELAGGDQPLLGFDNDDVARVRTLVEGFGSLAGTANPELETLDRLVLLSESRTLGRAGRRTYLDGAAERIAAAAANVRVLGDRMFRLTARDGTIPLTFLNDNPYDVDVRVSLASDKLRFTDAGLDRVTLRANRPTTVTVPVKALTSGAFPMLITLSSPDGKLQLGRSRFTITSTVASGLGILLSAGAALFLLLWWGSHWRTVRRARGLVPPA